MAKLDFGTFGLPFSAIRIRCRLLRPVMPCARNSAIIRASVSLFPRPRIADITALRFARVKMLGIFVAALPEGEHRISFEHA